MTSGTSFEIDFEEAKSIVDANTPREFSPTSSFQLSSFYGFTSPAGVERASGPCALGAILHHHQIGWNHVPRDRHGHPLNDHFIQEIMRWAECPNLLSGSMGSSPTQLLKALRKAGLNANWYAGNDASATINLIREELFEGRPVIALVSHGPEGEPLLLEWEVVFSMEGETVITKQAEGPHPDKQRSVGEFKKQLTMNLPQLSCSVITARKD